ncbi:carbohydrate ABC transporter permease [Paenibacillus alginolyticus]|uniref:Carbohydrate ABC transporter permease n=1 Tax=Paenibacillus alginolyticus TaxID=59839 RepID=A0ABT4G8C6_9BACL|nr:carbohydrate ABC transporter permease [Paenibacillus alginolyticus]MCY9665071.1 carbohydrate ABC transporter permease [Paenibacillus alginolyticus]MCY9692395.1 carbohydrate ABC transporter permease [Paenibacillus alginolyticus]MEC0143632.1 carbohydrate ABC transporter permease [Paenibacillus alginolyticus]
MEASKTRTIARVLTYLMLMLYAVITVIPFLWALSASFKTLAEISTTGLSFIPEHFTLDNYKYIFTSEQMFPRWFFNSVLVGVSVTLLNLLLNSLAGYSLARFDFPGNKLIFFFILTILMVPDKVTLIPQYLIIKDLGWLNSFRSLIIPAAVQATYIFMMRQFFISFPKELEEASEMDGMTRIGMFFRVALPLAGPPLAAMAIFTFMGSWNEFLKPLLFMSERSMFTLPLGLNTFKGQYISYWNYIMAASMIFTLPALLVYVFGNKFFIKGITFTGTK